MQPLTAMDLHFLVREWQALVESRINRVYQSNTDKRRLLIELHKRVEGKQLLSIVPPSIMHLTAQKGSWPSTPPGFCMFLRKHIQGGWLRGIEQVGFERIIRLTIESSLGRRILYIELFSKGNIILCDDTQKILSPLETQNWADRTIRGGIPYQLPPTQPNIPALSEDEFMKLIRNSSKEKLVIALAIDAGLSGRWAEELLLRAGLDKSLSPAKAPDTLYKTLQTLLYSSISAGTWQGSAYPFNFTGIDAVRCDSYNKALDAVQVVEEEAPREDPKRTRLLHILAEQELKVRGFEESAMAAQRKGELLYERYQEVTQLLFDLKDAKARGGWPGVKKEFINHPLIKQINDQTGDITLEL